MKNQKNEYGQRIGYWEHYYRDTIISSKCTPEHLLPIHQRLQQVLDLKRGLRVEKEITLENGEKMKLITIKVGK